MKTLLIFVLNGLMISNCFSQKIEANIRYATFNTPVGEPYVETYLKVSAHTLQFLLNENKKYIGGVEVLYLFKQGEAIKHFDKYVLKSPEIDSIENIGFNLLDQKRYNLLPGNYVFETTLKDINNPENKTVLIKQIIVNNEKTNVQISDIQLIESYTKTENQTIYSKSGLELYPYPSDFYPTNINKLIFYSELYNTDKVLGENSDFVVNYSIKKSANNQVMYNFNRFSKQKSAPVCVVLGEFNIEDLPTGNYNLSLEVRNKQNEILSEKKLFIQRSNKKAVDAILNVDLVDLNNTFAQNIPSDKLRYYLRAMKPIATENDKKYIDHLLSGNNDKMMRQYFLNFWIKRNADDPEKEWLSYLEVVKKVDDAYRTQITPGFETDRGRVYLQYGPPNNLVPFRREPGMLPYEIWHYYSLENNINNIKFVFYNPNLGSEDYQLIHSEARGELYDPRWQTKVNKSFNITQDGNNLDQENIRNHSGSWMNKTFDE